MSAVALFLAALLRKLEATASLTNVSTLYSVADAATKALTVDSALSTITDVLSLAQEIGKVPTSRVTMLSVPTVDYAGPNRNWAQELQFDRPAADDMFNDLKTDTAYTAPTKTSKTTTGTTSTTSSSPVATSSSASASGRRGRM